MPGGSSGIDLIICVMLFCLFEENSYMHIVDYGSYKRHTRVQQEVNRNLSLLLVFSVLVSLYFSAWCVYALLLATYSSFPLGPWRPTNLRQSGRGHADACGGVEDGAFLSWNSKLTHCSLWR